MGFGVQGLVKGEQKVLERAQSAVDTVVATAKLEIQRQKDEAAAAERAALEKWLKEAKKDMYRWGTPAPPSPRRPRALRATLRALQSGDVAPRLTLATSASRTAPVLRAVTSRRAPQRPLGCHAERMSVLECYNRRPFDAAQCVDVVDAFQACARKGVEVRCPSQL